VAEVVLAVLGVFYVFPFEVCAAAAGEGLVGWVEGGRGGEYRLPSLRTPATRSMFNCWGDSVLVCE